MAAKSDRLITEALGNPDSDNSVNIDFTSTTASGVLLPDTTYRFAATSDCYFKIDDDNAAADSDDMLFFGGVPEIYATTANRIVVNVIRKDADGTLHITPMYSRGK